MVIILIIVLCAIVATAAFFIIKNILLPTKADVLPKLYKQGKTQHLIKSAKQIISKDSKNYKISLLEKTSFFELSKEFIYLIYFAIYISLFLVIFLLFLSSSRQYLEA